MRARARDGPAFTAGVLVGLALGVVVVATGVALRRRRRVAEHVHLIDLEPDSQGRRLRAPAPDRTGKGPPRLESELPEFLPQSQRW